MPCPERPCQSRPFERQTNTSPDDVNAELRGRPILYTGVVWIGILRRFLIPRSCGSIPPATPDSRTESPVMVESVSNVTVPPPSPVPAELNLEAALLTNKQPDDQEDEELRRRPKRDSKYSSLAVLVKQVQEASAAISDQVQQLSHDLSILMSDGQASTTEIIKTVRAEDGLMYRYGVISTSGLLGYLIGLRRGTVVRLVYCATGTAAMASICYPEEAKWYNNEGLKLPSHGMVLALSLIKRGAEKILTKECETDSKSSELNENENVNLQKQSPRPDNKLKSNFTSIRNKFGTLAHHNKQNTQRKADSRLKYTEDSNQKSKESEEIITPPQKPEMSDDHPPSQLSSSSSHGGKLSSQCQADVARSLNRAVPYSPALPSPPKLTPPSNQPLQNGSEQTFLRESAATKEKSSFHANSLNESLNASIKESLPPKTEDSSSDLNSYFVIIPIPEPNLMIENEQDSSGNENLNKVQEQPLNKKLSRYYEQLAEEQTTSIEKGYDDLYSKRE